MERSESIGQLAKALSMAQGEMQPAIMDATNPYFGNRYATLGAVIEAVRPVLAKHGLSFVQLVETEAANGYVSVTTVLMHESGEWIEATAASHFGEQKGLSLVQVMGSRISYLRRYTLAPMFGVYAEEDVDGNEDETEGTPPGLSARAAVAERQGQVLCPRCGGPMWDNRVNKTNPKAPDYKCKDKACGGAVWPVRSAEEEWAEIIMTVPSPATVPWQTNMGLLRQLGIWTSKSLGLTNKEVHAATGVDSTRDFPGTLDEWKAMVTGFAAEKRAAEEAEHELESA